MNKQLKEQLQRMAQNSKKFTDDAEGKAVIEGCITDVTIFRQCKRMSNDNIEASFDFAGHSGNSINVYVKEIGKSGFIYMAVYYYHEEFGKPLAEIMQDLIEIEYKGEK